MTGILVSSILLGLVILEIVGVWAGRFCDGLAGLTMGVGR